MSVKESFFEKVFTAGDFAGKVYVTFQKSYYAKYPRKAVFFTLDMKRFEKTCVDILLTLHKKLSFPIRISSVNVTKSAAFRRFGQIY